MYDVMFYKAEQIKKDEEYVNIYNYIIKIINIF